MPIDNVWLYDNRVIKQTHHGTITGKQITDAITELHTMIRQGQAPVHIFIDAGHGATYADIGLGDLKTLVPKAIEGTGWVVQVQPNAMQRFLGSVGMQISGTRYKFVNNQGEAMEYLLERDPTLYDVIK